MNKLRVCGLGLLAAASCLALPLHADKQPDIAALVRGLNHPQFKTRNAAATTLALVLDPAHPAVQQALSKGSLEQQRRLELILTRRPDAPRTAVTDRVLAELVARHGGLSRLDLSSCIRLTSKGLSLIGRLPQLRALSLARCLIKTADLARLPRGLRQLDLSGCAVNLDRLGPLEQLESLSVPPGTDDAQLQRLADAFSGLKRLDLSDCAKLGDSGLRAVGTLRHLEWLDLSGCHKISDDGVRALGDLTRLQSLRLAGCEQLTDRALATLGTLRTLRQLDLSSCVRLTDLAPLRNLPRLVRLDLRGCLAGRTTLHDRQTDLRPPWRQATPPQAHECHTDLKQVGLAAHLYGKRGGGLFPPLDRFLRALDYVQRNPALGQCEAVLTRHGRVSREFIVSHEPIRSMADPSERPLIWCPAGIHGGTRAVLFLDGHTEKLGEAEFQRRIRALAKRAAKLAQANRKPLHER